MTDGDKRPKLIYARPPADLEGKKRLAIEICEKLTGKKATPEQIAQLDRQIAERLKEDVKEATRGDDS
ncbi:MAG: hypothetical protein AB8B91_25750 [Rubripirellula sp.]